MIIRTVYRVRNLGGYILYGKGKVGIPSHQLLWFLASITSTQESNPDLPAPRPVALPPGHSVGSLVIKVCFVRQGSEALLRGGKWVVTRLVTPAHRDDGYCSSESTPRGLKTGKSISTVYRFYYICYIVIPIIHHGKKLNYTRLEPQLVEVLGWHQTMSTLQLIIRGSYL